MPPVMTMSCITHGHVQAAWILCLMRKSSLTSRACTKGLCDAGAGAMSHWPALDRWQRPEYLLAVAGQRTVPIELGKHYLEEGWGQSLVSLGDFMARHIMLAGAFHLDSRSMQPPWLCSLPMCQAVGWRGCCEAVGNCFHNQSEAHCFHALLVRAIKQMQATGFPVSAQGHRGQHSGIQISEFATELNPALEAKRRVSAGLERQMTQQQLLRGRWATLRSTRCSTRYPSLPTT